jgi:hypothetical protein
LEYALARCDAYYRHKSLLFPYGFEDQNWSFHFLR